jgi:hypothetical protein
VLIVFYASRRRNGTGKRHESAKNSAFLAFAAQLPIDGNVFEQKEEWGHLLDEHYLMAIDDHLYPGSSRFRRFFPNPA